MKDIDLLISRKRAEGYSAKFILHSRHIACEANGRQYIANEVFVDGYYTFFASTDFNPTTMVFILHTIDGIRGVIEDAFGKSSKLNLPAKISIQ